MIKRPDPFVLVLGGYLYSTTNVSDALVQSTGNMEYNVMSWVMRVDVSLN